MKIIETIVEPNKIEVGSTFRLKVKAINYLTCKEMKTKTCKEVRAWTCGEVGGK